MVADLSNLLKRARYKQNGGYWTQYDHRGYRTCEARQLAIGGWELVGRLSDREFAALLKAQAEEDTHGQGC